MKTLALAAAAIVTATTVSAADLGMGVSLGAELDTYYDFDAEGFTSVLTPEVGYTTWGVDLTASMDLNLVTNDSVVAEDMFDAPVITFGAEYKLGNIGLGDSKAYIETDFDVDGTDFNGAKAGLTFAF